MRAHAFASCTSWIAAAGVAALLTATAVPAVAAPVPSSAAVLKSTVASDIVEVRSRGRRGGGVAAGIAAGLLLGGIIGSSPYYYGGPSAYYGPPLYYPPGYYGPRYGGSRGWIAYCFSRYRSFDPYTGTYLGYDGRRHYCR
jgi:hypothetical protein